VSAIGWALVAYLPLDTLAYVAVWGAAYLSDADRRERDAAIREGAARGELAVARLAGLRAQLRPHFLFNALNTASMLAARGDTEGTRRVLTGLGELLRYVMRGSEQPDATDTGMVAVREEIAFVEQYLAVERERFPERLRVTMDVAEDVQNASIPALLLQPLVENAIVHGVEARIGAGQVSVRGWRDVDTLRLSVQDDGPDRPSLTAV
jgi:LytS/YehU family sensor histidine kinase